MSDIDLKSRPDIKFGFGCKRLDDLLEWFTERSIAMIGRRPTATEYFYFGVAVHAEATAVAYNYKLHNSSYEEAAQTLAHYFEPESPE